MRYFFVCLIVLNFFSAIGRHMHGDDLSGNIASHGDSLLLAKYKSKVRAYINPNPDSALHYIRLIEQISTEKGYGKIMAEGQYLRAMYFRRLQHFDSAVFYFNRSLQTAKKYNFPRGMAVAYNGLCRIYYINGRVVPALEACEKCLTIAGRINDTLVVADTHLAFANIYLRENDLKKALHHFLKVDSIHTLAPLRPDIIAAAWQGLGGVYLELRDYDKAEEYYLKADKEFHKLPFEPAYYLNTTAWHLGEIYYYKGDYPKADSLLSRSYDFFNKIKDMNSVAEISITRGLIKAHEQQWDSAEAFLKKGYQLLDKINYAHEASVAALELGRFYLQRNKLALAVKYLKKAINSKSDKDNSLTRQKAWLALAEAYEREGAYDRAFKTLKKGMNLKDSLNSVQSAEKIRELEEIYNDEKSRNEIALLRSQNELSEQYRKNQFNLLMAVVVVLSLTGTYLFFLYRNRKKTAEQLEKLDKAKTNFFTNISHEFRTPLTLISGRLQRLLQKENLSEEEQSDLKIIRRNTERLLSLVNQLLDISKIEAGKMEVIITKSNLRQFMSTIMEGFRYMAEQKNITFTEQINIGEETYWFDKDLIEKIIFNLLSNAVKYTPENGHIECQARIVNNTLHFNVKNSGRGLSREEMKHVFKRFYQAGRENSSSGIGLALVKELITLYKGNIKVESVKGQWTMFGIELPLNKAEKDRNVRIYENVERKEESGDFEGEAACTDSIKNEKPVMLVVEDNREVREYIIDIFDGDYRVIESENGNEGLELTLKYIPDIIISDVKMPEMDGLEFCRKLRENEKTSHIPVILLTARAGEEEKLEGLKTGADDYITKPFNEELLRIKVKKLIEIREALRKRYSKEVMIKPKDIALTPMDTMFLDRLQKVMDDHLTDPGFTAEDFSREMGMSRMQLHRKLKALTGLSTTEFIRSERLKLAAVLLKNMDANISEVGYSVGFNDIPYFIRCFKKRYRITPKEYSRQQVEKAE